MEKKVDWVNIFTVCLIVTATLAIDSCHCVALTERNESYLIREVLLKNYDPVVRPVRDPGQTLDVNISMGMKSFIELDIKKQTMTSFGWLSVQWYDAFLTWNVSQFPVDSVHLSAVMVWRPELVIFNTVTDLDELEDQKMKLQVRHDGRVVWFAGGLFRTFCSIDISYYPLDTQSCSIEVMSWSTNEFFMKIRFGDPLFDLESIENHPEWKLVETRAEYIPKAFDYVMLRFTFTLKRKILFYVINIILPIVLLSLMNCLVFLLPVESGEKMTVSVTVFLSFAVFMSLIKDSLPQNSDSLCLFSLYVAVQMFLSVCSIFMAAVIVFIFDKEKNGEEEPSGQGAGSPGVSLKGSRLSDLSTVSSCVSDCPPEFSSVMASATDSTTDPTTSSESDSTPVFDAARRSTSSARAMALVTTEESYGGSRSTLCVIWRFWGKSSSESFKDKRQVSRALDKFCFVLTIFLNVVSGIVFIAIMIGS